MYRLILILILFAFPWHASAMSKKPSHTPKAIGVRTLHYTDTTRNRPVTVELWYPAENTTKDLDIPSDIVWVHPKEVRDVPLSPLASSYPLILMSHGHRGDKRERSWLADVLVRQGFVVASVEHFGNTWYQYNPLISLCFWERAKDITFALNCLTEDLSIKDLLDFHRIGFVGYSLGGMTGLALAGAQAKNAREAALACQEKIHEMPMETVDQLDFSQAEKNYWEPRIRSMLLICPANFVYASETLKNIKVPIGLIVSPDDEVLSYEEHSVPMLKFLATYKTKIMGKNVSHYAFLNKMTEIGQAQLQKALQSDLLHINWNSVHKEVGIFAVDFFKSTLKKRKE